jgi:MoxR-like ATPase
MNSTTAIPANELHDRVGHVRGFLEAANVERRDEIEILMLSIIAGVDVLFLGEPGVGKTYIIELLVKHGLIDMNMFSHLLAKDMSADEVLGPRDIMAMKEGQIRRITEGYAPEAHIAYLDEVFKASPPMLNPLLDLLANRVLKMGGETRDCSQLISIVMSSNELPDREDLMAFRDRIGITKMVEPVRTAEGRRAVTDLQLSQQAGGVETDGLEPLTLEQIQAIRAEMLAVTVPDPIREMMGDAQQKWLEKGHAPSQRRIGQMWRVIKAHAWMAGRDEVSADDLLPCQHMAWNRPDDAASAREVILEFASAFTRKAEELRQALEPVLSSMDELRSQVDVAESEEDKDKLMEGGFKFLRILRKLRSKAEKQIEEGKTQGQDVSTLEEVLEEINRSHDWAEGVLSATDEE